LIVGIDAANGPQARCGAGHPLDTLDDEFGQLSRAFDNLLDDRVSRLAEAERENEDLNNSVVQLLQAVAQLSNKDLTAKAPVTSVSVARAPSPTLTTPLLRSWRTVPSNATRMRSSGRSTCGSDARTLSRALRIWVTEGLSTSSIGQGK